MCVSIGIPFHNNEQTLADAIRSVYAQTLQDWELILVDDGSTDSSLSIAQAVAQADSRVRVISDKTNRGLPYRLNQISKISKAEYIARMDADDIMYPERLELQVRLLDAHPEVDVVNAGLCILDESNNPIRVRCANKLDTRPLSVLKHGLLFHATIMGRATWFLNNLYNETWRRAQDHELWCRTCQSTIFGNIPKPLYFYREISAVTLRKYFIATKAQRRIFRLYGPTLVGKRRTLELMLNSYMKVGVYAAFSTFGLRDYLVKRRSSPLSEEQLSGALEAIHIIQQTSVPGLQ